MVVIAGLAFFGMMVVVSSGLFGLGGGLLIVPLMLAMGHDVKSATATSLVIVIPTAISAVLRELSLNRVEWRIAIVVTCGAVIGAIVGISCKNYLGNVAIRRGLAIIVLIVGLDLLQIKTHGVELTLRGLTRYFFQ